MICPVPGDGTGPAPDDGGPTASGRAAAPRLYRYPDPDERLTLAMIAESGLTLGQWSEQESEVLTAMTAAIWDLSPRERLLDFGSGSGRLSKEFAGLFDDVLSVEPDVDRARRQREAMRLAGLAKVRVVQVPPDPPTLGGPYDLVMISHVIQHVSTADEPVILDRTAGAVRPGGYLLLLTALAGTGRQRFVVSAFDPSGRLVETEVNQAAFDDACRHNRPGSLPIRFFAYPDLVRALADRALRPVLSYGLHGRRGVVGPLRPGSPVDGLDADLSACRDVAVLAGKT